MLWLRPVSAEQLAALDRYRTTVANVARQAQGMRQEWLALAQIESDAERLANAAAVNRWRLARLGERLRQEAAPRLGCGADRAVQRALSSAARAFQLLANGYRFHKSDAVCDGQTLLVECVDQLTAASRRLDEQNPRATATPITRGSSAS